MSRPSPFAELTTGERTELAKLLINLGELSWAADVRICAVTRRNPVAYAMRVHRGLLREQRSMRAEFNDLITEIILLGTHPIHTFT